MHENTTLQCKNSGRCAAEIRLYVRGNVRVTSVGSAVINVVDVDVMT